jgi:hypothetical protein
MVRELSKVCNDEDEDDGYVFDAGREFTSILVMSERNGFLFSLR